MSDHTAPNMATAFGDIGYLDRGSGPQCWSFMEPCDAAQGSQLETSSFGRAVEPLSTRIPRHCPH
jgi:hypothetical protein